MATDDDSVLRVTEEVAIPLSELGFRFSRSGGPGGQHANRTETRVELRFDLACSPSLSEEQRERALQRMTPYLDNQGVVHLVSESTRSQLRNRQEVVERFQNLLREGLKVPEKRYPTRPTRASHEKRLQEKSRRSEIKEQRRRVPPDDE
jgi:ribosome-associated protein